MIRVIISQRSNFRGIAGDPRDPRWDKKSGRSLGVKGIFQILVSYAVELSLLLRLECEFTSLWDLLLRLRTLLVHVTASYRVSPQST
jgi:hypothetical protein